ncbi:MAG: hypothetical protein ICV79_22800, partial [Flavisolibacter sp.]|nr:hypothetical protein [Flavisolibacter sp.]
HIDMGMNAKAFSGLYKVIIKSHEGSEGCFYRMVIIAEAEKEIAPKPAYILDTSLRSRKVNCLHGIQIRSQNSKVKIKKAGVVIYLF